MSLSKDLLVAAEELIGLCSIGLKLVEEYIMKLTNELKYNIKESLIKTRPEYERYVDNNNRFIAIGRSIFAHIVTDDVIRKLEQLPYNVTGIPEELLDMIKNKQQVAYHLDILPMVGVRLYNGLEDVVTQVPMPYDIIRGYIQGEVVLPKHIVDQLCELYCEKEDIKTELNNLDTALSNLLDSYVDLESLARDIPITKNIAEQLLVPNKQDLINELNSCKVTKNWIEHKNVAIYNLKLKYR